MAIEITAAQVKELRERTGSGMMECKKALVEAQGDMELAIDNMRKSGQAKATKKAGRVAAEGIIVVKSDGRSAVMLEINSETDFVARDEGFKQFCDDLAQVALDTKAADVDTLLQAPMNGESVDQRRLTLISKIGENIQINRIKLLETQGGSIAHYVHGARIGVLIDLHGGDMELGKDVAMHIAASNPQVISPDDVPEVLIAKEREIFTAQAMESGKPKEIAEKMVGGRIKKFLEEISLMGQPFVKDPAVSVGALLQKANARVASFIRFEVGEGVEKETAEQKAEKFKAEVMAQVQGT